MNIKQRAAFAQQAPTVRWKANGKKVVVKPKNNTRKK